MNLSAIASKKLTPIIFSLLIILAVFIFFAKISPFNSKKSELSLTKQNKMIGNIDLSQENIVIYARCFSKQSQANDKSFMDYPSRIYSSSYPDSKCTLYGYNYNNIETTSPVYTFDYSKGDPLGNYGSFRIVGYIGRDIVYTENYYDKKVSDNLYKIKDILGIYDLENNKKIIIEDLSRFSTIKPDNEIRTDSTLLVSIPDYFNKKIYYQIREVTGKGVTSSSDWSKPGTTVKNFIKEYDLISKSKKTIIDNKILGSSINPPFIKASKGKIYLFSYDGNCRITKNYVFDSHTGTLEKFPKVQGDILDYAINKNGDKIAYIVSEKNSIGKYSLLLKVANTDGSEEKVIYTLNNIQVDKASEGYCKLTKKIENINFSPKGDLIIFTQNYNDVFVWYKNFYNTNIVYKLNESGQNIRSDFKDWVDNTSLRNPNFKGEFVYCPYSLSACYLSSFIFDNTNKTASLNFRFPLTQYTHNAFIIQ